MLWLYGKQVCGEAVGTEKGLRKALYAYFRDM